MISTPNRRRRWRTADVDEADHAGDGEIDLYYANRFIRQALVFDASWWKKVDAFFKHALSIFRSASSCRSRCSSAPSDSITSARRVSLRALNAVTMRPRVASLTPLSGDGRDRFAGGDDQLHGLVCLLKSELPT